LLRADLKSEMGALSRQLVSIAEARKSPSIRDEQPAPCSRLTAPKTTYASEDLAREVTRSPSAREVTRSPSAAGTQQLRAEQVREKCCSHRGSHEGSHGGTFSSTSTTTQGVTDHERGSSEAPPRRLRQRAASHSQVSGLSRLQALSVAVDALRIEMHAMDQHHQESIGKLLSHLQAGAAWPTGDVHVAGAPPPHAAANGATAHATGGCSNFTQNRVGIWRPTPPSDSMEA